jgi:thiol-disulfide isomerase/thioredoxin
MPLIESVYPKLGDDVKFMAIDCYETPTNQQIIEFLKKNKITFPAALDEGGLLADGFGISLYPTTIIVDPEGRILTRWSGAFRNGDQLLKLIANVRAYYKYVKFDLNIG